MNKKVLMIAAAFSLILLGGGGAYLFLTDSGGGGLGMSKSRPGYVDLDSFALPVFSEDQLSHYVLLSITVEVAQEDDVEHVEAEAPVLRDAFVRALFRAPATGDGEAEGFDLKLVKSRLLGVAQEVVGEGMVSDVLITRTARGPA